MNIWDLRQPLTPVDSHAERSGQFGLLVVRVWSCTVDCGFCSGQLALVHSGHILVLHILSVCCIVWYNVRGLVWSCLVHYCLRAAFLLRDIAWPLLWPAIFTVQDTAGIACSVQHISYSHQVPDNRLTKFVTNNYAPASVSVEGKGEKWGVGSN